MPVVQASSFGCGIASALLSREETLSLARILWRTMIATCLDVGCLLLVVYECAAYGARRGGCLWWWRRGRADERSGNAQPPPGTCYRLRCGRHRLLRGRRRALVILAATRPYLELFVEPRVAENIVHRDATASLAARARPKVTDAGRISSLAAGPPGGELVVERRGRERVASLSPPPPRSRSRCHRDSLALARSPRRGSCKRSHGSHNSRRRRPPQRRPLRRHLPVRDRATCHADRAFAIALHPARLRGIPRSGVVRQRICRRAGVAAATFVAAAIGVSESVEDLRCHASLASSSWPPPLGRCSRTASCHLSAPPPPPPPPPRCLLRRLQRPRPRASSSPPAVVAREEVIDAPNTGPSAVSGGARTARARAAFAAACCKRVRDRHIEPPPPPPRRSTALRRARSTLRAVRLPCVHARTTPSARIRRRAAARHPDAAPHCAGAPRGARVRGGGRRAPPTATRSSPRAWRAPPRFGRPPPGRTWRRRPPQPAAQRVPLRRPAPDADAAQKAARATPTAAARAGGAAEGEPTRRTASAAAAAAATRRRRARRTRRSAAWRWRGSHRAAMAP